MTITCSLCGYHLNDGDRITGFVTAWYKALPSKVAYAVYEHDIQVDKTSLAHYDCENSKNEIE